MKVVRLKKAARLLGMLVLVLAVPACHDDNNFATTNGTAAIRF
jgi:hypothetical protein